MSSLNGQGSELKDHLGVRITPYWELYKFLVWTELVCLDWTGALTQKYEIKHYVSQYIQKSRYRQNSFGPLGSQLSDLHGNIWS